MARILVIDDDSSVRSSLERALRHAGHEVYSAADGRQGLDLQRAAPADLIITDLFMPELEGIETLVELRKIYPETPVIAMSGQRVAADAMLAASLQLGAVRILQKPFNHDTLLFGVGEVLRQKSRRPRRH